MYEGCGCFPNTMKASCLCNNSNNVARPGNGVSGMRAIA